MPIDTNVAAADAPAHRPEGGHRPPERGGHRFVAGQHARVVRNTDDCPCTAAAVRAGLVVTLDRRLDNFPAVGTGWSIYGAPWTCPCCEQRLFGFLEADLEPVTT